MTSWHCPLKGAFLWVILGRQDGVSYTFRCGNEFGSTAVGVPRSYSQGFRNLWVLHVKALYDGVDVVVVG